MKTSLPIESAAVITADHIPAVPARTEPLSNTAKRRLVKLPEGERADVRQVLVEVDQRKAQVGADLGVSAPDGARAASLLEALDRAGALRQKSEALAAFAIDEEARANAAAVDFVNAILTEVKHVAKKRPAVAASYPAATTLTTLRAAAVAAGRTRARATRAAAALSANPAKKSA